jgi:hydroxymethylglutaryl-CoA synthase
MRGITSWGTWLPHWRLDRASIRGIAGQGGGRGRRTVASFDEDAVTMAVEASRRALVAADAVPDRVLLATVAPPVLDKTSAAVVHAALRLPVSTAAFDLGTSVRSTLGGLLLALDGTGTTLVAAGDVRVGRAGSAEESGGGDAGAAVLVGEDSPSTPVLAEVLATASGTTELVERWRIPGAPASRTWDERFAEVALVPVVADAWGRALADAGISSDEVDLAVVVGSSARLGSAAAKVLRVAQVADDLSSTVGITGSAHPLLCLVAALEQLSHAEPGKVVALVHLGDGADVVLLRTTAALATRHHPDPVATQVAGGAVVDYGRYLAWRGLLDVEPPRRPEPSRVSAPAAWRATDWKFGFTAAADPDTGFVHAPPSRVSADGLRVDAMQDAPLAAVQGTVATFTVDRVAYSPSPPIIFAVVDFDGGGRFPVELCDLAADDVAIGSRVAMTFRRLHAADGIPNYFWKARVIDGPPTAEAN